MPVRIVQVDAFTSRPFAGNPAGVCVLPHAPAETWMRDVAREMNLSETAFVHRIYNGFGLRWFTPTVEVDLCGHATLASAHVLWTEGRANDERLAFHTRSGVLTASRATDLIELDFPALENTPVDPPDGLGAALGVVPVATARNVHDLLAELADAATVRTLTPDHAAIADIDARAVVVTARSDDETHDFISRCFGPRVGINEDPVTGSAHCALGPYWQSKLDQREFTAQQVSARGGVVKVSVRCDRVLLGGQAVSVSRVEFRPETWASPPRG